MKKVQVEINGSRITCDIAERVRSVLDKSGAFSAGELGFDYPSNPVAGVVMDGVMRSLTYRIKINCSLTPIRIFSQKGRRIYRHSISFLLAAAASMVLPGRKLVIGHALGDGYYFSFLDDEAVDEETVALLREKMEELARAALPIMLTDVSGSEAEEIFRTQGSEDTVRLLSSLNTSIVHVYRLNGYSQISYEPIVDNTAFLTVWELRKYGGKGMLLRYPVSDDVRRVQAFRDNPLLFSVFQEYRVWEKYLGVRCLGDMNALNASGGVREYVRLSEDLHRRKIAEIADSIVRRGARLVFVAGPSSSGKTTFAKRLCQALRLLGKAPFKLSLDDYYNPPHMAPLDEEGKPDLEALEALNLPLIREHMRSLLGGRDVFLPSYHFTTHETTFSKNAVRMEENTVMVVEGIHALSPAISGELGEGEIYKVYISALTQLNVDDANRVSTSDNRLLRRIVRDHRTRGMSAVRTLGMWQSVTRGETRHIFPNQNNADTMFNSALDYETGVLSTFARPLLMSVKPSDGEAYTIARRLLGFLENIYPVPAALVPSDSLLREFIGEGDYE